jgi:hypothetical protein
LIIFPTLNFETDTTLNNVTNNKKEIYERNKSKHREHQRKRNL